MICKSDAIVNLFSYSKFRILMTLVIHKDNLLDSMNLNYCIELVTMVTVLQPIKASSRANQIIKYSILQPAAWSHTPEPPS